MCFKYCRTGERMHVQTEGNSIHVHWSDPSVCDLWTPVRPYFQHLFPPNMCRYFGILIDLNQARQNGKNFVIYTSDLISNQAQFTCSDILLYTIRMDLYKYILLYSYYISAVYLANPSLIVLWQHGRVKVKSTAQQEEEKRKEREKKLKLYIAARDACFSKVWYKEVMRWDVKWRLLSLNYESSCMSDRQTVYFALIWSCLTEEGGYFGRRGSSADPAAAVIQPWLCNSVELQKRDPGAFGNWEVSFPSFPGRSRVIQYERYASLNFSSVPAPGMRTTCRRFMRRSCCSWSRVWR